jgi:hypothetical protein
MMLKFSTISSVWGCSSAIAKIVSVIFTAFVFIGCGGSSSGGDGGGGGGGGGGDGGGGGGGGGGDSNGSGNISNYMVSIYDRNLDLNRVISGSVIDLSKVGVAPLYEANSSKDVSSQTAYNVTRDINLYGIANVTEITNQTGLSSVRNNLYGAYILLDNVNLNGNYEGFDLNGWIPIGSEATPFRGIFSGNGYTIRNLWINKPSNYFIGLFGHTINATIKNLGVELDNARGGVSGGINVGSIAGYADGTILTNIHVRGSVRGINYFGGIAGVMMMNSTLTDSSYIGNVNGTDWLGGIIGQVFGGSTIANVYFAGNVSGDRFMGGIAGHSSGSIITNSYVIGNVSGISGEFGGIVGRLSDNAIVTKNYVAGNIKGNASVGGIVGNLYASSTITDNAVMSPSIVGNTNTNRIVGAIVVGTTNIIRNNFALNTIKGNFTDSASSASHGISKTDLDLKTQITYSDKQIGDGLGGLGWLFGNNNTHPWVMPTANYPKLYWQK